MPESVIPVAIGPTGTSPSQHEGLAPVERREPRTEAGLACTSRGVRVVVGRDSIAQVIELDITSPPLITREDVVGFGQYEKRPIVAVHPSAALRPRVATTTRVKGVLLRRPDLAVGYLVVVDQIESFCRVSIGRAGAGRENAHAVELPPWMIAGTTDRGVAVHWVDVDALIGATAG